MTKKNVSEIEKGIGFLMGVVNGMMDLVREKQIPFAAIYRLATAEGNATLGKIVDLAYEDWRADQTQSAQMDHGARFFVQVTYNIDLAYDDIRRRFPGGADIGCGISSFFKPIMTCEKVTDEAKVVGFDYVHLNWAASHDEALAEIDKCGFRPAMQDELIAFAAKYPGEQVKFPIAAVGSEYEYKGIRNVAILTYYDNGRSLELHALETQQRGFTSGELWKDDVRFLVVRK